MRVRSLTAGAAGALFLAGCTAAARTPPRPPGLPAEPPPPPGAPLFEEVASGAGLDFRLGHGGRAPLTILETAPGGCAILDFDGDGLQDLALAGESRCALYRNLGGFRFREVTAGAGLPGRGRWMGCAVGDYDGDGKPDLLLTGYRTLALLRNLGGGRFQNVTHAAGLRTDLWTTSAEFTDVDGDGRLDLYVGAYVRYHIGTDDLCRLGPAVSACGPEHYEPEQGRLYRNMGGGRFRDVTAGSGLGKAAGKTWGAAFADYDGDGRQDLYLANDMTPSNLFHNRGGLRFEEVGLTTGTGYDRSGRVMGAMGVDWGDTDGDGRPDLLVTTYFQQPNALYFNRGAGDFQERADEVGLAAPSLPYVKFGGGFLDADNDGRLDLLTVSGHVRDNIATFDASQSYSQPMQLFLAREHGFTDVSAAAGPAFRRPFVGRGAAFGDLDNDGDTDVIAADLEGSARLLRNTGRRGGNSIRLRLVGRGENPEALGARVTVSAGGERFVRWVKRGGSVLSAHEPLLPIGLGRSTRVDQLEVRWPDGSESVWKGLAAGATHTLEQHGGDGSGVKGGVQRN